MATRDGTWGSFTHMATKEVINTYNAIHKKLVELNLGNKFINQELVKLVQECNKRHHFEVWLLKRRIEQLKRQQESMKLKLRETMAMFFQSECSEIGDLEGFILEQEVYNLLSTKRDDELTSLMGTIDGFLRCVDMKRNKAISLTNELYSNPAASDNDQSQVKKLLSEPGKMGYREMSLSEIVVKLYAFSHDKALDIQKCLATRKLVSEAFKNNDFPNDFHRTGNGVDPMDYLDHKFMSENCELEDEETLNWKRLQKVKQKFQHLLQTAGTPYVDVLKAMKIWVFHIESVFYDIVYNLYSMLSGYEPALIKFQQFNSKLKKLRQDYCQVVPIIVLKILAIPEVVYQGTDQGSDKAVLCNEMDLDEVMKGLGDVITILGPVLRKTSSFILDKRALTVHETVLDQSEWLLKDIGFKIKGAKLRLEKAQLQVESITKKTHGRSFFGLNSGIQKKRKLEKEK